MADSMREAFKEGREKKRAKGFEVPPLEEFPVTDLELLNLEEAEKEAEKLRKETLPRLQEQVNAILTWLEGMTTKSREAQELMEEKMKERQSWLQRHLQHKFGPYRRTTWVSFLTHYLSKDLQKQEEVQALLAKLCQEGHLQETKDGPLEAYGKTYTPSESASLDEPEISQLKRVLNDLLSRVRREQKKTIEDGGQNLLDQGELSTEEFLEGKPGKYAVEVPERKAEDGRWYGGGTVLVKSDGKKIKPLSATGGFQEAIEEAKKLGVAVLLHTLKWESLSWSFLSEKVGLEEVEIKRTRLLWHLLKRAIAWKEEKEKIRVLKEELASEATLTPEEFFLQGKSGSALVEYPGTWVQKTREGKVIRMIDNLFLLVERQEGENSQPAIRIVSTPPWLKEFFSECQEEYPEKGKFEGLPGNLRAVLQGIWGQVQKRSQINNHQ